MGKPLSQRTVPVCRPVFSGNEKKYLNHCIDSQWVSSEGPFVREFEKKIAARVERRFGVAVSSGTAALEIALQSLSLETGSEVILPSFTIVSCANAILRAGAVPVFVDSDPETWTVDPKKVLEKISERTRALLLVHLYGLPVDMKVLLEAARARGIFVIEDASQALGSSYFGQPCGSFGTLSTFSFYANKTVTTGEGGMIVTDDPSIAARASKLRNLCFEDHPRFVHYDMGWNYRMSNLSAAVGVAQLENLDSTLKKMRENGRLYHTALQGLEKFIQLPVPERPYSTNDYWVFGLVVKPESGFTAALLRKALEQKGVQTRPFFWPMHLQPCFSRMQIPPDLDISEHLGREGFYLPSGAGIVEEEVHYVTQALRSILIGEPTCERR